MQTKLKKASIKYKIFFITVLISFLGAVYFEMFFEACDTYNGKLQEGLLYYSVSGTALTRLLFIWGIGIIIGILFLKKYSIIMRFLFRYRYVLALIAIIICVSLKLSGSSIACWKVWIGGDASNTNTVFGIPRMCAGDDYAVFTPYIFSQEFNHSGSYLYYNETIRGMSTDVAVVYGLPIKNIITLFRPFLLGYLFLGSEMGLSFYWITRLAALFLATFEFFRWMSKDDRWLSVLGAFLVTFGSVVQWWFATNALVEMIIFGELAVLCFDHYMRTTSYKIRFFCALGFAYCGLCYIFTIYPAWQVAMGYVFLALFIYVIIANHKEFTFSWKKDGSVLVGVVIAIMAIMLYFIVKSWDTIVAYMNTVYPGGRESSGGGVFGRLFQEGISLFLPLTSSNLYPYSAEREMAQFFSLFPLGLILSVYLIIHKKKQDPLLIALDITQILLLVYCSVSLPEFLLKVTFLKYCTPHRAVTAVGYIGILQLIRVMQIWDKKIKKRHAIMLSLTFSVPLLVLCCKFSGHYMTNLFVLIYGVVLASAIYMVLRVKETACKKLLTVILGLCVLLSGGTVNPVQKGCDVIFENALVQEIQKISDGDDGLWLVEGEYPLTEIPIVVGAPTINSTNMYPAFERWEILDPEGEYEDIYNRYAHIPVELTTEDTEFLEGAAQDTFTLRLNYNDLEKIDVKYVLSTVDHEDEQVCHLKKISQIGSFYIYEVL